LLKRHFVKDEIIHKCKGVMPTRRFKYKQNNAVLELNEPLVSLFCPFMKTQHFFKGRNSRNHSQMQRSNDDTTIHIQIKQRSSRVY